MARVLGFRFRLSDREGRHGAPREVDRKDASHTRKVACIYPAVVRFSGPPAESEAKTQARSIGAALLERAKQFVDVPARETAAFILDLDQDPLGTGADPQRDGRSRPGKLERVLQDVHHHRGEDLSVRFDRHTILDGHHPERDAAGVRRQCAAGASSSMKSDTRNGSPILNALREPDLGHRTGNEIACAQEAPIEHGACVPCDSHVPGFDHLERDDRGVEQVPQFMGKESEPLVFENGASIDGATDFVRARIG